jgi:hypothetical protein
MSGDYSRLTFDPQRGYTTIREQQGRVRLDADFNEFGEYVDRRARAETMDILDAPQGTAIVPDITINGQVLTTSFKVDVTAGVFTLAPGRAYVDGILVECWGGAPSSYDSRLGEIRGTAPLPLTAQPFYYQPNFPLPTVASTALVYLDVWSRELTMLEEPALKDKALGGLDTTTRLQTAWQVKALNGVAAGKCSDTPQQWLGLVAPCTGRLSTLAPPGNPSNLPCTIDPVGGYTGLENRLYRVEIYASGTVDGVGAAKFLWSSENAAVGQRVLGIAAGGVMPARSTLQFSTIGRDALLRFQAGDVLEYRDDDLEFSIRERRQGGPIVHVVAVHSEEGTVDVDVDLSADFQPNRNPRVRRWNADPIVTQLAPLMIGTVGIQLTFGNTALDTLAAGDYWVFAARTADGTIEELAGAPPRGTLHHYAKLALIVGGAPTDCRIHWPPPADPGCCTKVVFPGDDIQAAIDSIPRRSGGCICLKAGVHAITKSLVIDGQWRLVMHSESPHGAVVRNTASVQAIRIGGKEPQDIRIGDIRFEGSVGDPAGRVPIMMIAQATGVEVSGCSFGAGPNAEGQQNAIAPFQGIGIAVLSAANVRIERCQFVNVLVGISGAVDEALSITGCRFSGPQVLLSTGAFAAGGTGIQLQGTAAPLSIVDNFIEDYQTGISLLAPSNGAKSEAADVRGNTFRRHPPISGQAKVAAGLARRSATDIALVRATAPASARALGGLYAIECEVTAASICANGVDLNDPAYGGILVTADRNRVVDNVLESTVPPQADGQPQDLPFGIVLLANQGGGSGDTGGGSVINNTLTGLMNGITVSGNAVDINTLPALIRVADNVITTGLVNAVDATSFSNALAAIYLPLLQRRYPAAICADNAKNVQIEGNAISAVTVGAAILNESSAVELINNAVTGAGICVFADRSVHTRLNGDRLTSATYGVFGFFTRQTVVSAQRCDGAAAAVLMLWPTECEVHGSTISNGRDGIVLAYSVGGAATRHNVLSSLGSYGIAIVAYFGPAECTGNLLQQCCTQGVSALMASVFGGPSYPYATAVWVFGNDPGIRNCVIQSTGGAGLAVRDLIAVAQRSLAIENSQVMQSAAAEPTTSRAIDAYAIRPQPTSVDVSLVGNEINVPYENGVTLKGALDFFGFPLSGAVVSSNTISALGGRDANGVAVGAISVAFDTVSFTGNRVNSLRGGGAVRIRATESTSAVGNATYGGLWSVIGGVTLPKPIDAFNVIR